ncbi:hypothetical protein pdam_00021836 [Pocillopora damicornis]|uniref:Protein CASP n=1 Tax=Pocillopora damicornis TaxID=46731 RepID=A0A3M6UZ75_POCDA|nr:hypothetical protein pdam_00021836 [Pocillopora damicornis]
MAASSFQSMRNFWKEFSLPDLQKSLDTTAAELADRQDESDTSRKKLVELSRDFKKNTPEDTRKKMAPLLKSFQAEVRALSAERQVESLREELIAAQNALQSETIDAISRSSLEHELAAKERQISQLVSDVQQSQVIQNRLKESTANEIARLEDQLASKTKALQQLEEKLDEQGNYEEIKRELNILKSIEFSTSEESRDAEKMDSTPKSLEMLLLDKNKRLQSENTSLKVENVDLTGRYSELHVQYNEAVNTVKEQKELITQLETDLLSVNALPSAFRGQGEQLRHNQQQISVLQNEVDTLRSDNVKLYEKIKFLQSYPTKSSGGREEEATVSRYSSQYEQRLDPFSAFNQREKQQRYLGLSPHEKVTLNLGRFIMSNKFARTFVFFYTLLVHLMIFLVSSAAHSE